MSIDAVYYINLDRSKERRHLMKALLKDETFDSMKRHRIKAIDGSRKDIIPYLHSKFENLDLTKHDPKIYCCLLSHLNAIVEFSKSPYSIALIVEDDLSLDYKKYWQEDLTTCIRNAPKDWGILQVAIISNKLCNKMYTNWKDVRTFSTAAYIINKKEALRFIKKLFVNKFILKGIHTSDCYIYENANTYVYKYPYFTYTGKDSILHSSHVKKVHLPSKKSIDKLLKNRTRKKSLREIE